jgi:hypothetical protein
MKNYKYLVLGLTVLFLPTIALAANPSLQKLLTNIPKFINNAVIPFLFGIAFLLFIYNVIRYFVLGADNKDLKENAKNLALYSVGAFVFLIVLFGIVNMFVKSTGLDGETQPCSDYQKNFGVCP